MCGICLSASFTQHTVTVTQVQKSVSDFDPESESRVWGFLRAGVRVPIFLKPWSPTKNEDSHLWWWYIVTCVVMCLIATLLPTDSADETQMRYLSAICCVIS